MKVWEETKIYEVEYWLKDWEAYYSTYFKTLEWAKKEKRNIEDNPDFDQLSEYVYVSPEILFD